MHILITGSTGRIGRLVAEELKGEHRIRGLDQRDGPVVEGTEFVRGGITDRQAVDRAMEGVDAVIHLAADPSPSASWEALLESNFKGTYEVFDAAREAGARRIVFASSNHATGIYTETRTPMTPDMPVAPANLYGVSKAFGEALGRYYSHRHGLSVICLRIGWVTSEDDHAKMVERAGEHFARMYLSHRDLRQLIRRCIDAEDLPFGIFYAMSSRADGFWDLSATRERLGFQPQD